MSANNFLSNMEPRIPTRVKDALGELLAGFELEAAVAAGHSTADGELAQHFRQLVRMVDQERPQQAVAVKQRMTTALTLVDRAPRFAAFRGVPVGSGDVLSRVDLVSRHKTGMRDLAATWAHIPSEVPGAHVVERNGLRGRLDEHVVVPQTPYTGLRFYLSRVQCLDETGGWFEERFGGKDEIHCGAVAVDENGNTSSGGLFSVGSFDDGDVRTFGHPGRSLQYFSLREGGDTFPKVYTMAIALVEHDFGNLPDWFNRLLELVRQKVTEYLAALVGVAVGSTLGPLGALIGAAIGWAVGKVINLVKGWLGDEDMGTKIVTATINSYSGNWIDSGGPLSNLYTRDYVAHDGHYRLWWRCELVR